MDEADHVLVAEEALQCQSGRCPGITTEANAATAAIGGGGTCQQQGSASGQAAAAVPPASEALRRARVVQDYLCSFEAQGLPVVRLQYGVEGAIDRVHEYILQCIQVASAL
jgi:hypothetical protein